MILKLFFSKIGPFYVSAYQNTTVSQPKDVFSYRNPFDSCLMKMTYPTVERELGKNPSGSADI